MPFSSKLDTDSYFIFTELQYIPFKINLEDLIHAN